MVVPTRRRVACWPFPHVDVSRAGRSHTSTCRVLAVPTRRRVACLGRRVSGVHFVTNGLPYERSGVRYCLPLLSCALWVSRSIDTRRKLYDASSLLEIGNLYGLPVRVASPVPSCVYGRRKRRSSREIAHDYSAQTRCGRLYKRETSTSFWNTEADRVFSG